jgi:hypothetical protein
MTQLLTWHSLTKPGGICGLGSFVASDRIPVAFSAAFKMKGGVMRKALIGLLIAVPTLFLFGSCGPSVVEERQEETREQQRIAANDAVAEKRREEGERERTDAASAAFHEWFIHAKRALRHEPRKYDTALESVSLRGETLVLALSIADTEAAIELCDFTLKEWSDRARYGVSEILVVSVDDDSTLAQSTHLADGARVCQ